MQKVAAYRLEIVQGMTNEAIRKDRIGAVRARIDQWMKNKGGDPTATHGNYSAMDGAAAEFVTDQATDGGRTWWIVRLQETTQDGRLVTASISVTGGHTSVVVYVTLEVGSKISLVNPIEARVYSPRVIRDLLALPGPWQHGAYPIHPLRRLQGFDNGEILAGELLGAARTLPMVVVSEVNQRLALPDVASRLAGDLAGLANVVIVDEDASWALTDILGRSRSCYNGAVRIYWPRFRHLEDPLRHPLWTRERLVASGPDALSVRERFRGQLRHAIMHAAALSTSQPAEIDDIRKSMSLRIFQELRARARSLEDYQGLADLYAAENAELRGVVTELRADKQALDQRSAELEDQLTALGTRIENAEQRLRYQAPMPEEAIAPDSISEEDSTPQTGDVRYYKKHHSARTHDIMIRVSDCGCDNWENAHAADKARKGISKLEDGRSDWKALSHCASCTGGGMWRVKW